MEGERAVSLKAQYLHGNHRRKCDRYKCEGHGSYPGSSVTLPWATNIMRCWDGVAEVSRSHSRFVTAD